ncbi:MAG: outer membrane beta-barrel protein [Flavobacteriales bacterium]
MRVLLSLVLWQLAALGCGQTDASRARWQIGASGSVDACYRTLVSDAGDETRQMLIDFHEDHERIRPGWTVSLDVIRELGEHWRLASGLQLSDKGYLFSIETVFIATDGVDPEIGTSVKINERYHYRYLSVPLVARYSIGRGKLRFEPGLGLSADYLLEQYKVQDLEFSDGTIRAKKIKDNATDYRDLCASACLELTASIRLGESLAIRFGPRARYQMTPLADTPIRGYLWEAGFLAGATLRL